MSNPLSQIREGMTVCDRNGDEIGRVDYVQMTDEDPSTPGPEIITAKGQNTGGGGGQGVIGMVADVFRGDDMPDALQAQLMRSGFIRIDVAGLFQADRYVLPGQIASVSGDRVVLAATRDELVKR